jgi:hypothetical protein
MPISLWGGHEPEPRERPDIYGYGPDLPPLPSVHRLTEAEYAARRRVGIWLVIVETVLVVGIAVAVGFVTRSFVAIIIAAALVPAVVLGASFAVGAALGVRRLGRVSVEAEPSGGGDSGHDGPDDQGQPVVHRH